MPISDHPNYMNIETQWNSVVSIIEQSQAQWVFGNPDIDYFQGLSLLGDSKPDGITQINMQSNVKPYDQDASWNTFNSQAFKTNLKSLFNIMIDVYRHPEGRGYTITGEFWYAGLDPAGDHILKHHYVGPSPLPNAIYDEWYAISDSGDM